MAYEYNILQNENVTPEQWKEMYMARAAKDQLRSESLASLNSSNAARGMEGYLPNEARMRGYRSEEAPIMGLVSLMGQLPTDNRWNASAETIPQTPELPVQTSFTEQSAYSPAAEQESNARAQMSTRFAPRGPGLPFEPGVRSLASLSATDWPEEQQRFADKPYLTGDAGQSPNLQDWKQGFATGAPANQMGLKVPYIKFH